jgi:hypothetical protein
MRLHPPARLRLALALAALLAATFHGPSLAHAGGGTDTLSIASNRIRSWQVGLARPDRLKHASLAFTIASGTGLAGGTRRQAFALSLGLGTLKELWDRRHGGFDPLDLTADAIGAALGARASAGR